MRLKSIELSGFKTFATKSEFSFAEEVTVIVGPNGSGKSNIADAVRWVLGEQSYKMLRGKKTADMIFSGSDERSPAGMATATITFDNSEEWLPIDFSEVSITRRAYRDGKNEYLINGQQVLLRDINELLAQSGLAERTYTIIGQGLVDAALALKAEERRGLFEEAAGIGLYRSRREEAEKRLEKTWRNLERVEDILAELKPRLRSLERQASRSEKHARVKEDLQVLMREWYGYHWYRIQEELQRAAEAEKLLRMDLGTARKKQAELDQKLSENQSQVQGLRARLNSWHRELSQQHAEREEITRELAVSRERIRSLQNQHQDLQLDIERLTEQEKIYQERVEKTRQETDRLAEELEQADQKVEGIQGKIDGRQAERTRLRKELENTQQSISALEKSMSRAQARQEERLEQIEKRNRQIGSASSAVLQAQEVLREQQGFLEEVEENLESVSAARQKAEEQLESLRQEIQSAEDSREQLKEKRSRLETSLSRTQAQLEVLQQAEDKLAGYANGARLVLKEARSGKLAGTLGALSSYLEVEERLERPIAAALGDYLDAVVVEGEQTSQQALELLLARTTRGALLPLQALAPPDRVVPLGNIPGLIGNAAELVKVPPKLRPAVDLLLGRVLIVEDRTQVKRALKDQPVETRAVTLEGEVFHLTGQILAGNEGRPSTLSRSRQRRTWEERLDETRKELEEASREQNLIERGLEELQKKEAARRETLEGRKREEEAVRQAHRKAVLDLDQARQRVEWQESQQSNLEDEIRQGEEEVKKLSAEVQRIGEEITSLVQKEESLKRSAAQISLAEERQELAHWETRQAVARRALSDARTRLEERETALQELSAELNDSRDQLKSFQDEKEWLEGKQDELEEAEGAIEVEIKQLEELISSTEVKLETAEGGQGELRSAEAQARKTLNQAERAFAQAEVRHTRAQDKLEAVQDRISEDLGLVELDYAEDVSGPTPLPLEGYVEKLPRMDQVSEDLGETIKEKRAQLRRLGAINPEARKEYRKVKQRFEFMTEQLSDLRKAESDIKEVIAELELLMEREFRKTFDAVAVKFREIFTRLFGGGEGRLVLSDPEDLSRTGVDIEARLPGRRTQGLSLLSGGERSLTAAALIFSLLKISPTPFCVLDEVDAMLDESNVARYRNLLRELSSETQFIVITHNRNTVQVADIIYGITMGEDSTSQVLSLKLEEVEEIIEERV